MFLTYNNHDLCYTSVLESFFGILFLFLCYFSGDKESQQLEIEQQGDPDDIKHVVISQDLDERHPLMYRDVESALPFEFPEPIPVLSRIQKTHRGDLPLLGASLLKRVICYQNIIFLKKKRKC